MILPPPHFCWRAPTPQSFVILKLNVWPETFSTRVYCWVPRSVPKWWRSRSILLFRDICPLVSSSHAKYDHGVFFQLYPPLSTLRELSWRPRFVGGRKSSFCLLTISTKWACEGRASFGIRRAHCKLAQRAVTRWEIWDVLCQPSCLIKTRAWSPPSVRWKEKMW